MACVERLLLACRRARTHGGAVARTGAHAGSGRTEARRRAGPVAYTCRAWCVWSIDTRAGSRPPLQVACAALHVAPRLRVDRVARGRRRGHHDFTSRITLRKRETVFTTRPRGARGTLLTDGPVSSSSSVPPRSRPARLRCAAGGRLAARHSRKNMATTDHLRPAHAAAAPAAPRPLGPQRGRLQATRSSRTRSGARACRPRASCTSTWTCRLQTPFQTA